MKEPRTHAAHRVDGLSGDHQLDSGSFHCDQQPTWVAFVLGLATEVDFATIDRYLLL